MGTDIHGPWIEQENGYKPADGRPYPWECIARIGSFFGRDYLLFDILNGMRHGNQSYTIQTKTTGIPPDPSHDWRMHFTVKDAETGVRYTPEDPWPDDLSMDTRMRLGSHFGFSVMTLDEVKRAQEAYIRVSADHKCSPAGVAEAEMLAEKEAARARGEKVGMVVFKGLSVEPDRHPGLDLVITLMEFAEEVNGRPTRLAMCYDN